MVCSRILHCDWSQPRRLGSTRVKERATRLTPCHGTALRVDNSVSKRKPAARRVGRRVRAATVTTFLPTVSAALANQDFTSGGPQEGSVLVCEWGRKGGRRREGQGGANPGLASLSHTPTLYRYIPAASIWMIQHKLTVYLRMHAHAHVSRIVILNCHTHAYDCLLSSALSFPNLFIIFNSCFLYSPSLISLFLFPLFLPSQHLKSLLAAAPSTGVCIFLYYLSQPVYQIFYCNCTFYFLYYI